MDYRTKDLAVETAKDEPGFTGYLAVYGNTDRDGDTVAKGAFAASVASRPKVPMLFNHDRNAVIGKLELAEDERGVYVKGTLNLKIPLAQEVYAHLTDGDLDSLSVGMGIKEFTPKDPSRPFGGWDITKAEVYEGSVVTIPSNASALIDSVKQGARAGSLAERLEFRRASILAQF